MRIVAITTNEYGERFVDHLRKTAPASWAVVGYGYTRRLPVVIDEPEEFIPSDLPEADLLLYVGQNRQLAELLPELAETCKARAVVAPVDNRAFLPTGLANQIIRKLAKLSVDAVFPAPFCSLTEENAANPTIRDFASRFGRAKLQAFVGDRKITKVSVMRGAPCGNTHFVAERLPGTDVSEAVEQTGLHFHAHPCMASMDMDVEIGDTILHIAGYLVKNAVQEALGQADDQMEG